MFLLNGIDNTGTGTRKERFSHFLISAGTADSAVMS